MSDLVFTVHEDPSHFQKVKQYGKFTREWQDEEEMDDLLDLVEFEQLPFEQALNESKKLMNKYPANLEIQGFVAAQLWNNEFKDEAAEIYEDGYIAALKLIPKDFKGRIEWGDVDNRPFLRLAHGYLLSLIHYRDARAAHSLAKQMLRWSPHDQLNIQHYIGDILLLKGDTTRALTHYLKATEGDPTNWYPAALLTFRAGNYVTACTYLRKGILTNPYIAEGLTGRTQLQDHLYWHGSNMYGCDFALAYLNSPGNDWTDDEIDFIDWVFNSPAVLRERAVFMDIHIGLTVEHDWDKRHPFTERYVQRGKSIDEQVSVELVRKIRNSFGEEILPWDRVAHQHPAAVRRQYGLE